MIPGVITEGYIPLLTKSDGYPLDVVLRRDKTPKPITVACYIIEALTEPILLKPSEKHAFPYKSKKLSELNSDLRGHGYDLNVAGRGIESAIAEILIYSVKGGGGKVLIRNASEGTKSPRKAVMPTRLSLQSRVDGVLPSEYRKSSGEQYSPEEVLKLLNDPQFKLKNLQTISEEQLKIIQRHLAATESNRYLVLFNRLI